MSPRPRRALASAVAGLVASAALAAGGGTTASAAAPSPAPEDRPTPPVVADDVPVDLEAPARGTAAVRALGADLGAAGAVNDMTGRELADLLREDPSVWVDEGGKVFFTDPVETHDHAAGSALAAAAYPLADTFRLHSRPGSNRTIFLDFDGADVRGTRWNSGDGVSEGFHPGWSLDADAAFSDDERARVQSIWQRVAEDYAPFDVDVTTEAPDESRIRRTDLSDQTFGTRVLIGESTQASTAICSGGCGGVAYLDVFDVPGASHDAYQPAWVFPQSLDHDTKNIAEAVSHEVGHNLALSHDGASDTGYYAGHGIWAPIMGVGYDRPLSQWSRGSYPGATNSEDDLGLITTHGLTYRADEAPPTTIGAPALPTTSAHVSRPGDVDVYALGTCAGSVQVRALNAPTSPDLDLRVRLLDLTGAPVAAASPASGAGSPSWDVTTGTDATVSATLPSGTYFAEVDGVGDGAWTSGGYDDYGSLGAYDLTATGCSTTTTTTTSAPGAPQSVVATADGADSATLTWTAPASAGSSPVTTYVVARAGADPVVLPATARSHRFSGLAPATAYGLTVAASSDAGTGVPAETSVTTDPQPVTTPSTPRSLAATWLAPTRQIRVTWAAPADLGGASAAYRMTFDGRPITFSDDTTTTTSRTVTVSGSFAPGASYAVAVRAVNTAGSSPAATTSVRVPAAVRAPGRPGIARARRGPRGTPWTAVARWSAPSSTGGARITRYLVRAHRLNDRGRVVHTKAKTVGGSARATSFRLRKGARYRFSVRALNSAGYGPSSARSPAIRPR